MQYLDPGDDLGPNTDIDQVKHHPSTCPILILMLARCSNICSTWYETATLPDISRTTLQPTASS